MLPWPFLLQIRFQILKNDPVSTSQHVDPINGKLLLLLAVLICQAFIKNYYSIIQGWSNDDRIMIACCNDGTRPVNFKIERIDIPENDAEREWLAKQNFMNTAETAYTG